MKPACAHDGSMQLRPTQLAHQPTRQAVHAVPLQQRTVQQACLVQPSIQQHARSRVAAAASSSPHGADSDPASHSKAASTHQNRMAQQGQQVVRPQQPQQQHPAVHQQLASACAAAVITLSSCLAPAGLAPPAQAQPRMTAEERVSVEVFKKSTPSVVNVTNLTAR